MNEHIKCDYLLKIILVGNPSVGKSALMNRYVNDIFNVNCGATIGVDFHIKIIEHNGERVKLQVWDTGGQDRFKAITTSYYRGANCAIIVYDLTQDITTNRIKYWYDEIDKYAHDAMRYIVVGNKLDLNRNRMVNSGELNDMLHEINPDIEYYEASAKSGEGVKKIFEDLAKKYVNDNHKIVLTETTALHKNDNLSSDVYDPCYNKCCNIL